MTKKSSGAARRRSAKKSNAEKTIDKLLGKRMPRASKSGRDIGGSSQRGLYGGGSFHPGEHG